MPLSPVVGEVSQQEPVADPQIDRLNAMLDKVIRIQHPQEQASPATVAAAVVRTTDAVLPGDSTVNSIAAVVTEDQTLTAGTTIALRIVDSIRINGRVVPAGQLVYGTVTLNGDRLSVHIGALREGRNLYPTDWQVYDLDGLAGIHIPGLLGRDVAKQSADQGVSSLNLMTLDPSLGAQAAGAGIQAAKTFLGRKVRQVRVTVRAGYQVLLRGARGFQPGRFGDWVRPVADSSLLAPDGQPAGPVLERCRTGGVELRLREIRIAGSCLWFGLEWVNRSPIGYTPAYVRWTVRDRRAFRRTALQEEPLAPMSQLELPSVDQDSVRCSWVGFRPFALAKDKELILEAGEKGGGRTLQLTIQSKQILKAKTDAKASRL
ncbi:hypothetical protein GCM10011511_54770 [Puia dinghuensis]|uniref:Conjugative transposon TraM C-terminal domain-containing protein n=2 Tax=Puia dinghuensis TaxID=1792502 RepID=A0A8J2UJ03_9BACT|nr:hypothetical protein GCM10011511_54770 [Puia dinghuensis]